MINSNLKYINLKLFENSFFLANDKVLYYFHHPLYSSPLKTMHFVQ